ncbi:hypothetical protein ACFOM8_01875 [Paracoccus angustae]|uniref:Uncharacterized protein n=1 Tax=Paracoccus angustae TaxID=1671480 RepID=A0ABV7TZQ5_9RHOB
MTVTIKAPGLEGQTFEARLIIGGVPQPTVTITNYGMVPDTVEMTALGARVNVLQDDVTSPTAGRAAPRPDGKTTLNLLDVFAAQDVTADLPGGSQALIHVTAAGQASGHVNGEGYWLPIDPSKDRFICEPGQRHRKMYVSNAPSAMTRAQIAAHATANGTATTETQVNGPWLLARPQYGGSAAMAVSEAVAKIWQDHVGGLNMPGRSDHYFLERGYTYTVLNWGGLYGEDELHPMRIASFGSGALPITKISSNFHLIPYCVVQDVETVRNEKCYPRYNYCVAYDHVTLGYELVLSYNYLNTFREVKSFRTYHLTTEGRVDAVDTEADGTQVWRPQGGNYCSGIYGSDSDGIVIDSSLFYHAGWADGYDKIKGSINYPQPPTMFSHGIYLSQSVTNMTVRYNYFGENSSCGTQLRGGVHLEGNLSVDNNINLNNQALTGKEHFSNNLDNVGFSAAYRTAKSSIGSIKGGHHFSGIQTVSKGGVLAHHADPENSTEIAAKPNVDDAVQIGALGLKDTTKVYKWGQFTKNVEGLDTAVLELTTAQRLGGLLTGTTKTTIRQLSEHLIAAESVGAKVKQSVRWARSRFGWTPANPRTAKADLVFVPDPDFEGVRWDNHYNWSTDDLPGLNAADTVDLSGNFVRFALVNAVIASLKSSGGLLEVFSGRLNVGTLTDALQVAIKSAGQLYIGTAAQALDVFASGGRLNITSQASQLSIDLCGQAQALFGPNCTIPAGKTLAIGGSRCKAGWDGSGSASMTIAGKLQFGKSLSITTAAGANSSYGPLIYKTIGKPVVGSISGFTARVAGVERQGANNRGDSYRVYLDNVVGTPVAGETFEITAQSNYNGAPLQRLLTIGTVSNAEVGSLQRLRSGAVGDGLVEPTVTATVNLAPTAQIVVPAGLPAGTYDLTGPGVTVVNNGASLPAGVTVTGGKLVLTVS